MGRLRLPVKTSAAMGGSFFVSMCKDGQGSITSSAYLDFVLKYNISNDNRLILEWNFPLDCPCT
jgi:hypothetical protein